MTPASLSNSSLCSNLPEDVGRTIFEHLAVNGSLSSALICKRVQAWVEPIIYREVSLPTKERSALFHRTVVAVTQTSSSRKPRNFFSLHVKSLLMYHPVPPESAIEILRECTSVKSLALILNTSHLELPEMTALVSSSSYAPKYLLFHAPAFRTPGPTAAHFSYPLFANVTHLEVVCFSNENHWDWSSLAIQVAFALENPAAMARHVLPHTPKYLKVFLIVLFLTEWFRDGSPRRAGIDALAKGQVDPRATVGLWGPYKILDKLEHGRSVVGQNVEEWIGHWSSLDSAGLGFWSQAEEIIERRKRQSGETTTLRS